MTSILSQKELEELCLFSGTYREEDPQEVKDKWHEAYRKVEAETNQQIEEAGSVEKWYESGRGRLLDFEIK
jgi:hypothetical protein